MVNNQIKKIKAKQILDSRKKPTIQVDLFVNNKVFSSQVPAGASTGKYEAKVLKTDKAIEKINKVINLKLIGKDPSKQKQIDDLLIKLDGTKNKSKLGANALCGVSMAVCRAGAGVKNISLFNQINQLYQEINKKNISIKLPKPCFNIINGGAHARNKLDVQEFMIVPQEKFFADNLKTGKQIYQSLKKELLKQYGEKSIKLGDEGGFIALLKQTEQAISFIVKAIEKVEKIKKTRIALDCAASQFFKKQKYYLDGKRFNKKELISFYQEMVDKYNLISLEDPFAEQDYDSWSEITRKLGQKTIIIGDDLLVTNTELIKKAKKKKACNGLILKINQIGTVTEALKAARLAKSYKLKIMVSHRSGETNDDFIADLAVGIAADFIKSGAPFPQERMTKYNRLVKIEKQILI